ncbi:MAG: zf-TFIIB domain-containing protein [Thermoplasmata archaeon]|nr:zf-TFIIB domain-containing protein [Thermoplasmata archaeon]
MRVVKCPICGREMKTYIREGVEVDQCVSCGGIWLDRGELESLAGISPSDKRILSCPLCGSPMSILILRGVEVDHCTGCGGVWLDRGELEELSHPGMDEFKAWLDFRRSVEVAKDPVGRLSDDLLDDVFVMYKGGLLVASCTKKKSVDLDEDLLAGMLIAIRDFVKTAFSPLASVELESIDAGEKKLMLERGKYLMIAAVASGEGMYKEEIRRRLREGVREIEERYGDALEEWDGDLDKLKGMRGAVARIFS